MSTRLTGSGDRGSYLLERRWSIPAAARRLMVSQDTMRTHVKHIYAKIGIHSRDDLVEIIKMPDGSLLPKSG